MKFRALSIWPLLGLCWSCRLSLAAEPAAASAEPAAVFPVARFRFDAGAPLLAGAGVARDGTLCVGTVDGYVHALSADGGFLWSYHVEGAVTHRPVSAGQLWYVATSSDRLYALGPSGALLWLFKPPSPVHSELAVNAAGSVFYVAADRYLYGVSRQGGVTLRAPFGALQAGPNTGPDGAIFAENQAGSTLVVASDGVRRWPPASKLGFEFPALQSLLDPEGHRWLARADGGLEFYATPGSKPIVLDLAGSPLLGPVWDYAARYAVLSTRSGLVFALAVVTSGSGT